MTIRLHMVLLPALAGAIACTPGGASGDDCEGAACPQSDGGTDTGPDASADGCRWECTAWETACDGGHAATRSCVERNGCGSTASMPPTTTTLAALDARYFRCNVQPILDVRCGQAGCHGADGYRPLRVHGRGLWRADPGLRFCDQTACLDPLTATEWCRNFDSARSFATADPAASELVRQPLAPAQGGLAHAGFTLFAGTSDTEYQTLLDWLGGATLGACDDGYN